MIDQKDFVRSLLKKHMERETAPWESKLLLVAFWWYDDDELNDMIEEVLPSVSNEPSVPPIDWCAFVAKERAALREKHLLDADPNE